MPNRRLQELFKKYLDDTLTPGELSQLYEMVQKGYDPQDLSELLDTTLSNPAPAVSAGDEVKKETLAVLLAKVEAGERREIAAAPVIALRRRRWIAGVAAALILLLGGNLYWISRKPAPIKQIVAEKKTLPFDIPPGKSGAVLTLANGKHIELDNTQNGHLAMQGSTQLLKQGAEISYKTGDAAIVNAAVLYNTMTTPRGRQFQLVLADGTRVWLNAASSIRFPTSFTGTERRVEITGEAYFEVVHNDKMPFRVYTTSATGGAGSMIEDIGTAFNINAYADEPELKTTLVEGSASVNGTVLKPGQQVVVRNNRVSVSAANVQQALAWKNGFFSFDHADIYTVMRQLARWYDVEVKFEGNPGDTPFQGKIGRDLTLAQVLKGLEQVHVHFRIGEDKRIVILP